MPDSFQTRLGKYLRHQLNLFTKIKNWKRRKPKRWVPDLTWLTSSFAAMDVSNQLKEVFKFFDENGDGKISPLELKRVLQNLGHEESKATIELAEGIVREMDCNGDGFIDLDEFMIVMDNSENKAVFGKEENSSGGGEEVLNDAFLVFDNDKDGFISAKELQRVLAGLGCGNCSLRECRKMIKGVDRDGDGLVDFEEFKSMMTAGGVG